MMRGPTLSPMLARRFNAREGRLLLRPLFLFALIATLAAILAKSWMRWMDPQVDFGWQLYLPWRLSLGEHLGRDYIHAYGPLSSYLNAGLFKLFGVSVQTLVIANLAIYGAVVWLLFSILRRGFGFLAAASGTLVGVVVFGFGYYSWIWNYTYAAPYSHEATHGIALLLWLVFLHTRTCRRAQASGWLAGIVLGLICLTKVEVTFAAGVVTVATVCIRVRQGFSSREVLYWAVESVAAAGLVLTSAWLLLAQATDAQTALKVVSGGFLSPFLYPAYSSDPVSLVIMGLDQPAGNVRILLEVGLTCAAYVLLLTGLFRWAATRGFERWRAALLVLLSTGFIAAASVYIQDYHLRAGRALPVLMVMAGAVVMIRTHRASQRRGHLSTRSAAQMLLWIAGVGMMARVMLAPRVYHYGFYLTMLAAVWVVAFFISEWPRISIPHTTWRWALGLELAATAGVAGFAMLHDSLLHYELRTHVLGDGHDSIQGINPSLYPSHAAIESTRRYIAKFTPPDSSVLVIPEGIMLNYWTRRKHPLPVGDLLPSTVGLLQRPLRGELERARPDYIVMMSRNSDEPWCALGFGSFARDALQWIDENYQVIAAGGVDPLAPHPPNEFGVRLLQYRTQPSPSVPAISNVSD